MPSIAFITDRKHSDLVPDDRPAADALRRRGLDVEGVVWDDPSVDWHSYDAIVFRSCWDYFHIPEKFADWIDQLEAGGVRTFNSLPIVRWNHDKKYLRDLEQRGIEIAPTFWCERGNPPRVSDVLAAKGWQKAVVKPNISGASFHTWVAEAGDHDGHDRQLAELLKRRDMMIQEYMPEIEQGEWSLIFFDGEFSHAAVKRPKQGDFRVQEDHGGTWTHEQARNILREQAKSVLSAVDENLLYARVDGVVRDDRFILMELEIIEPTLFFGSNQEASERFAEKLLLRL